jgi:hypothetical protein
VDKVVRIDAKMAGRPQLIHLLRLARFELLQRPESAA